MTTDTVGGVWRYAVNLASGLVSHGITTTLVTLGPLPSALQREEARLCGVADILETQLPLDWQADCPAQIQEIATSIAALTRSGRADIVQLNNPVLAHFASFDAPVVGVCHSCQATWWDSVLGGPLPADMQWRTDLLGLAYAACNILVAPSIAYGARITARYGYAPVVVANGSPKPVSSAAVSKENFILTAGRLWDKGKNFATLDKAAALVTAPVYAAGALSQPPNNEVACFHAIPLGHLDASQLGAWMERAVIFASVALYEPFGLAVLEAAQRGCALVLSDTPGFRELWADTAVFVTADDAQSLAVTLQQLLDDPDRLVRLGNAARHRSELYTVATMADRMASIYRNISGQAWMAA